MYDDPLNGENKFEKFPGGNPGEVSAEQMAKVERWEGAMENGVPNYTGEQQFGVANENNEFYGEAAADEAEAGEAYDKGISDAAALINYGLNAAAREKGVEYVVQTIRNFNAFGSEDPIKKLFSELGVDTPEEKRNIQEEDLATKENMEEFRGGVNAPSQTKSIEGALKAIEDMKELIAEVEVADPRYEELRAGAKAAGKGYFEYAVSAFGTQDLTTLFKVLAMQREKVADKNEELKKPEEEGAKVQEGADNLEKTENKPEDVLNRETLNPEIIQKDEI